MSEENKTTQDNKVEEAKKIEDKAPETTPEKTAVEATKEEATKENSTETDPEETSEKEGLAGVKELPHRDLKPGMVVRVHETIKDVNTKGQERERVQMFEGTILGFGGSGISRTMTVRKVSGGIGVEKIYPLSSPHVSKVEIIKVHKIRRAKFWFLRRGRTKRRMKEIKQ